MKNNSDNVTLQIAPCGMNCSICLAFLRKKNTCSGCWREALNKPAYCIQCIIKNCALLEKTSSRFCYECEKYPCIRLKQLDKRYRLRYNMSMLENLETIKKEGLEVFMDREKARWRCPQCGETICVHRGYCLKCKAASID
ncbi:MAG TPA: DUF3795 domain-containing protein [Prolixibacteraceae bacterium]|nr:DUF3795 domain-containing protein [Prolixibacteraceae bacterium]